MENRVLVGVLAAVDAAVAAAVGLAAVLAPLTLLWAFGFGDGADWAALWPAAGRVWQVGHVVPVVVTLPPEYAVTAGVQAAAATFTVSLAPLALAAFTAIFAARSGRRAATAGAPVTGAATGAVVFAAIAGGVLATTANPIATVAGWQAILLPAVVFAGPAALGALAGAWLDGDGALDRLRGRFGPRWEPVPAAAVRATALALAGLVAVGALVVAGLLVVRGGDVVALFQAGHTDPLGATVVTVGQLGYLPTLVVWAVAFVAGPGFALGTGTVVSPGAIQLPIVPGIPVLGAIPPSTSVWLLLVGLVPVAVGALAGHRARRDLTPAFLPRTVVALALAALTAVAAGIVAAAASGSLGPGTLTLVGPDAVAVAVAIGAEVLLGAAIALLAPARGDAAKPDAGTRAIDLPEPADPEVRATAPVG